MDESLVPEEKLVEVDAVRRSFPEESYYPLEHKGYKWHFLNQQTQDEILFMKMNDPKESVRAQCCPNASLQLLPDPELRPRESIEARVLVFTDY
ncbi:hypothetical protein QQS21_004867 [Conoideocrella luteorostrata]|uniref:Uncharacterized protein n=1 Tax=Conoideocrella luteorostrata TaxID=1105319 RepID=A0AAJ0CRH5_9HYPO|nr:hypothetical protein QQS21_004867 [Conoideocrella luteorostrata]